MLALHGLKNVITCENEEINMTETTLKISMLIGTVGFFLLSLWVSKIYARSYIKKNFPNLALDKEKD
jgi:hypothetical protein